MKASKDKNIDEEPGLTSEKLDQALSRSTEFLTKKWSEFAATQLHAIIGVEKHISELKDFEEKSLTSASASVVPVSAPPDLKQWPARDNKGQVSSAALILMDAASRSEMSMKVGIDYTKMSMMELHLCQLAIMKEIQERDQYSQMQLENAISKQQDFATQLEAAEQRKRDAERKRITLVRVLDEACRSLPDFDV